MSEHLLREFVLKLEVSTVYWETMMGSLMEDLKNKLVNTMERAHFVVYKTDTDYVRDYFILEDGTLAEVMIVIATGYGYRLDESADQTLRKLAIDEATSNGNW